MKRLIVGNVKGIGRLSVQSVDATPPYSLGPLDHVDQQCATSHNEDVSKPPNTEEKGREGKRRE